MTFHQYSLYLTVQKTLLCKTGGEEDDKRAAEVISFKFHSPPLYCGGRNLSSRHLKTPANKTENIARPWLEITSVF